MSGRGAIRALLNISTLHIVDVGRQNCMRPGCAAGHAHVVVWRAWGWGCKLCRGAVRGPFGSLRDGIVCWCTDGRGGHGSSGAAHQ